MGLPSGSLEVGEWPDENPRPPEALKPGPAMAPRDVLPLTKGTRKPDIKWHRPICQSTGQGKAGPLRSEQEGRRDKPGGWEKIPGVSVEEAVLQEW